MTRVGFRANPSEYGFALILQARQIPFRTDPAYRKLLVCKDLTRTPEAPFACYGRVQSSFFTTFKRFYVRKSGGSTGPWAGYCIWLLANPLQMVKYQAGVAPIRATCSQGTLYGFDRL